MSINGVCWPYPCNFHVLLCKWGQRCFIMSVMSFIIFVKMPLRSSSGSLRFFWLYFFSTHPYENLNALWHWELQSGTAVTSKMVWTLFFSLPVTENVLFTDTMQKAQHERWDWGVGGEGGHRGKKYNVQHRGMGGMRARGGKAYMMHSKHKRSWKAIKSLWAQDARKTSACKKPVVVYWKVTFTCVVPGW